MICRLKRKEFCATKSMASASADAPAMSINQMCLRRAVPLQSNRLAFAFRQVILLAWLKAAHFPVSLSSLRTRLATTTQAHSSGYCDNAWDERNLLRPMSSGLLADEVAQVDMITKCSAMNCEVQL